MPSDSKFLRDENGNIAVRVFTGEEQLPASDPDSMFTRDTDGNIAVRVVNGAGSSGGGDSHNKGYFTTEAALEEAYATAEEGDFAVVGETDTIWIWDTDNSEWVDSDRKGQVTSVNNQTGAVTVSEVPAQTGHSGEFLTTDGSSASWSNKPLVNTATGQESLSVAGTAATGQYDTNVGYKSSANGNGTALGFNAIASNAGVACGRWARATGDTSTAVGNMSTAGGSYSVAIGCEAKTTANYAIQISSKYGYTNPDTNTFKVGNNNGNFEIMSADGTIPTERLVNSINKYSTMPTAAAANVGWIVQYTGTTNANYTHGYVYESKNIESSATATTTGSITVSVNKTTFETQITTTGVYVFTYVVSSDKWLDENNNEVNLADYGISYTGVPINQDTITVDYIAAGYNWVQTNVQPAPEALPSQTGQSGKFLTTDGTDASWSDKPLVNTATGTNALSIFSSANAKVGAINIGVGAKPADHSVCIGNDSKANGFYSVVIGREAEQKGYGISLGYQAKTTNSISSIAIGYQAEVQSGGCIAIGRGTKIFGSLNTSYRNIAIGTGATIGASGSTVMGAIQIGNGTNLESGTVCFGSTTDGTNWNNYKILDSDGTIPTARLSGLLEAIYGVGALYFGTQSTCPMATLMPDTTWELVSSGKAIWTGDGTNAGTTIAAALPNIKGVLTIQDGAGASKKWAPGCTVSGAFTKENLARDAVVTGSATNFDNSFDLGINAHESNSIYDDNATTVQPPAYVVNVWRRTA